MGYAEKYIDSKYDHKTGNVFDEEFSKTLQNYASGLYGFKISNWPSNVREYFENHPDKWSREMYKHYIWLENLEKNTQNRMRAYELEESKKKNIGGLTKLSIPDFDSEYKSHMNKAKEL